MFDCTLKNQKRLLSYCCYNFIILVVNYLIESAFVNVFEVATHVYVVKRQITCVFHMVIVTAVITQSKQNI